MGNETKRSHPAHRRAAHIPWAAIAVIGGLLVTVMALVSLGLDPRGGVRAAVWATVGLGGAVALAGALGLAWQRLRARRGLSPGAGAGRRLLWPGVLVLLFLAFLSAILPLPYPSPWLSLVAPILFLTGAAGLVWRILSDATPLAYHRALRAYQEGDASRALALVRQAAGERPDDALYSTYGVHHLEAILLREGGELSQAREVADRLVARRPELYYGHAEQGLILLASGDAGAACEALERAVARAPHLAEGHYNLGMARAEAGDAAGAAQALERALRLGLPDEVTRLIAHYQLHRAYQNLNLPAEADAEARWLRRQGGTLRRWREAVAADTAAPWSRRRRDEAMIAAIGRVVAGKNRNARGT
jgi:Tfp pilus assembly protein PilF